MRQIASGIFDVLDQFCHMGWSFSDDQAIFRQVAPQGIDYLGALAHQQVTRAKYQRTCLCRCVFHRHKPHRWPLRRLANRFRIGRVILLPLYKWLHVFGCDQLYSMPQLGDLPTPMMGAPPQASRATTQLG